MCKIDGNFVPRDVPGRDGTVSKNPGPSRPVARFWACPVVPLSRDKKVLPVPLSQKVSLSRPVGNPSLNLENGVLSYSTWKLFTPLDGVYLPHLIHLDIENRSSLYFSESPISRSCQIFLCRSLWRHENWLYWCYKLSRDKVEHHAL